MAKNEAAPTSDRVTAAHQELERAKAEHKREARRLEETNQEIRSLTKQVKLTDPDDAKAFERLVAARDAARGRAEALAEREERTRGAVERAQRAVDEADSCRSGHGWRPSMRRSPRRTRRSRGT